MFCRLVAGLPKVLEDKAHLRDNPSMSVTIIDKKHRMTLPESICAAVGLKPDDHVEWRVEDGEIRGRKLVAQKPKEAFPRGSLFKYLTPERDKEQLAILSACVQGPVESSK
jgi:bifunctional DNA-binding transcriptional regulator/antitoxin component of YhaV-PrlF toxin-antitoxin module